MTIGLPKALLYYRYGHLWETFFKGLGCNVITSEDTSQSMMAEGIRNSVDECCLPIKLLMGHVSCLIGRCDYILVPRFKNLNKHEEFCVRFWGLHDIVRSTYHDARLLSYNLQGQKPGSELHGFLCMGRTLGKNPVQVYRAYQHAKCEQLRQDLDRQCEQDVLLGKPEPKILLAAQPYIIHDPCIGWPLVRIIREQGGVPIYADRCDRQACREKSREVSADLYWTMNKEAIGAIPYAKHKVDGVLLVTAFPCGTDSLVNDLVIRRVKDVPLAQILMDEQQGEAGLQTRIECFLDIIKERMGYHAG